MLLRAEALVLKWVQWSATFPITVSAVPGQAVPGVVISTV